MKLITRLFFLVFVLISVQTMAQTSKSSTITPLQASINRGKTVYLQQCLACHQVDGGGVPNLNPPLNGASAVRGKDKARLIRIVLKGMTDRVEIDGEEYSNNMAPHPELTDRQIADVLTYIRNSWSNKAIAVSAAEVKAVRAKLK